MLSHTASKPRPHPKVTLIPSATFLSPPLPFPLKMSGPRRPGGFLKQLGRGLGRLLSGSLSTRCYITNSPFPSSPPSPNTQSSRTKGRVNRWSQWRPRHDDLDVFPNLAFSSSLTLGWLPLSVVRLALLSECGRQGESRCCWLRTRRTSSARAPCPLGGAVCLADAPPGPLGLPQFPSWDRGARSSAHKPQSLPRAQGCCWKGGPRGPRAAGPRRLGRTSPRAGYPG